MSLQIFIKSVHDDLTSHISYVGKSLWELEGEVSLNLINTLSPDRSLTHNSLAHFFHTDLSVDYNNHRLTD